MSVWTLVRTFVVGLFVAACAEEASEVQKDSAVTDSPTSEVQMAVVGKLRTHCQACHAIGNLRFIYSSDNAVVWNDLFSKRAPGTNKLWAEGIIEVLSWPTDQAPPHDQMMDPPRRDWMPKGAKRNDLANDLMEGRPARQVMIEQLDVD